MPKLEDWGICFNEAKTLVILTGAVYNDARFPDGSYINTTSIQKFDYDNHIVVTKNTIYELGEPNLDFVNWLKMSNYTINQFNI